MRQDTVKFSTNAWRFIQQCYQLADLRDHETHAILKRSLAIANKSGDFTCHNMVSRILGDVDDFNEFIKPQREMVRALAESLLGNFLGTQEQHAGPLVALVKEFGVGIAFVYQLSETWEVTFYSPEQWGGRVEFPTEKEATDYAAEVQQYGNFL